MAMALFREMQILITCWKENFKFFAKLVNQDSSMQASSKADKMRKMQ